MRYNMKKDTVTLHRAVVIFIGILATVLAQRGDKGNYIVPRTKLELKHQMNKTAGKLCFR